KGFGGATGGGRDLVGERFGGDRSDCGRRSGGACGYSGGDDADRGSIREWHRPVGSIRGIGSGSQRVVSSQLCAWSEYAAAVRGAEFYLDKSRGSGEPAARVFDPRKLSLRIQR